MLRELDSLCGMGARLRWSRDRLVDYQGARLRTLVDHAYRNVPYYRRLFDRAGLRPQDIRGLTDLGCIPITSKADLHEVPIEDRVARGVDPRTLIERHTGGSTGRSTIVRRTWAEERLLNAFRFRAHRLLGSRLGDRLAIVAMHGDRHGADRRMLSWALAKSRLQPVAEIDCRRPLPALLREIARARPDVIAGYPGVLSLVAQAVLRAGRLRARPRFVATGGEVLTATMRRQIGEAFEAPVYDLYGCHEFNLVAWECPHGGAMHTCDDLLIVEVLRGRDAAPPGCSGEIVGTNLHAYASPIIRFRLEDVATRRAGRCACGLPHATIDAVQGRLLDYFLLPDGRLLHPLAIIGWVLHDRTTWLRQFQLEQQRRDLVVLRAAVLRMPSPERLRAIRAQAIGLLGGADFRIEFAPELAPGDNGKFRLAHSLIRSRDDPFDWSRLAEDPARAADGASEFGSRAS
jgi:phenylacetate-CoA ligase